MSGRCFLLGGVLTCLIWPLKARRGVPCWSRVERGGSFDFEMSFDVARRVLDDDVDLGGRRRPAGRLCGPLSIRWLFWPRRWMRRKSPFSFPPCWRLTEFQNAVGDQNSCWRPPPDPLSALACHYGRSLGIFGGADGRKDDVRTVFWPRGRLLSAGSQEILKWQGKYGPWFIFFGGSKEPPRCPW